MWPDEAYVVHNPAYLQSQSALMQPETWKALADPDSDSSRLFSFLPSERQPLQSPSCEDRVHLRGKGDILLLGLVNPARIEVCGTYLSIPRHSASA